MSIRGVVVGIDHWEDLTERFIVQLTDRNPFEVFLIDNASREPYPVPNRAALIRLKERVGYGEALNRGARAYSLRDGQDWEWLLCCNNDCICEGDITRIVQGLRNDTVYGNAWKFDYEWMADLHLPAVVDSAYLLIPRRVWDRVGCFDPEMDAAFEEIDYGLRVIAAGFRLDVVELPITHLNLHTRRELEGYDIRWHDTSERFHEKYKILYRTMAGAKVQEVRRA
jgi:GT2 family glycosyltransferase